MFLIDTDIIIYSLKNIDPVIKHFKQHSHDPKAISVITYGELIFGAERSKKRIENLAKVRRLPEVFPIIEVTPAIMDTFGSLKAELQEKGQTVDSFDLVIAATAITCGYCLVTNNEKHFKNIPGLRRANWSKSS